MASNFEALALTNQNPGQFSQHYEGYPLAEQSDMYPQFTMGPPMDPYVNAVMVPGPPTYTGIPSYM